MPRLLEADAEFLTLNYDTLAPDKQAEAKGWLQRYKQQQADEGEPLFPSVVTRQIEQENNLRRMFEAPDKIDYDPGYTSADPLHDKMQHANMALLSSNASIADFITLSGMTAINAGNITFRIAVFMLDIAPMAIENGDRL